MAQVSSRYEQNPFTTLKTRGFPKVLNPCGSNQSELLSIVGSKQHSKSELVLVQRKKHDTHLLSKLSPYFRSCVSQEFLETKQSTADEKLPSLCYSCNRNLDRRLEKTISFNRIKLRRRVLTKAKDKSCEDRVEKLPATPWKYNREQTDLSWTPFQRLEKAQSFAEFNKRCSNRSPPFILPEVIKITPQKKKNPQRKAVKSYDTGLAPPPTPIIRYIRDLSPEVRNIFSITMASAC